MLNFKIIIYIFFLGINFTLSSQSKTTFIYKIINSDTLKLDVYKPEDLKRKDRLPVFLWMHGGGFSGGLRDGKAEVRFMEYLTNKGYVGISISYRLLRKGKETGFGCMCPKEEKLQTFKQAAIDFLDATSYIIDNEKKFNVDKSKIIAGGNSAGAEAVLSAVYMKSFFVDDYEKYKDVKFAGVISLAGALMNVEYINEFNCVPTALFHGAKDSIVPINSASHRYCGMEDPGYLILNGSQIIAERLKHLKKSYYFNEIMDAGHEANAIPFDDLDLILEFFNATINPGADILQTKRIKKLSPENTSQM